MFGSTFELALVLNLMDNLTSPLDQIGGRVDDTTSRMNNAFGTMQKAGMALAGVGAGIISAGIATATSTFETKDALGELASLGVTDLEAVEKAAKSFSDTWAGTTKSDFITASYDIKSGIASLTDVGVAQFTELAALTGKATKSTTEEMGSLFATGYGIYKGFYDDMSDLEFGEMFSAGIATAVKNYKTAGSEMASAISMLGATATNNNVPMEEQLAILGQLQTTMSGSEAATKYKSFLNQAASAGEKLGLTFVDANNQLLSTPEILETLKTKYGDTIDAVEKTELKSAFGTDEAIAMIDLLYKDVDGLTGGIDSLAESMKSGKAVTQEMAETINNTPAQKFQVLKQQVHNNVEELGNGLLPVVNETMDKVSGLISKGSEWISNNQETVSSLMNIGMKLGVVLLVLGTLVGGIGTVGKAVLSAKTAITALKDAWGILSGAFATSPVGWVVVGIVALIAAFVLLWNKSEAFRGFWMGLFDQIKGAVTNAWAEIQPALQTLWQNIMELYEAAKPILDIIGEIGGIILIVFAGMFVGAIQGAAAALEPLINALSSLVSFATNVINMIVALFSGDFAGACDFAAAAVDDLKNFFINGFDAILSFIGGFADGFLSVVGSALSAVGIDAEDTISGMKDTIHSGLDAVKGFFGDIMGAAADTTKEKLNNIKTAYQENGGGIQGIAAAAMEGVKGYYTSGLSFVDNLTGGKLTAIKNKFLSGLEAVSSTVSSKIEGVRNKFNEKMTAIANLVNTGIEKIKSYFNITFPTPKIKLPHIQASGKFSLDPPSVPKFDVKFYAKGGIMTKPTVFGASGNQMMVGGEAGDEAILPLSVLWDKLKLFIDETILGNQEEKTDSKSIIETISKLETRSVSKERQVSGEEKQNITSKKERTIIIQRLEIKPEMGKLADIAVLQKLIDELVDSINSSDDDGDDDLVTA